jgi:hypothetical protein
MCSEVRIGERPKDKMARLASTCVPAPVAACSLVDDGTMFIYGSNGPIALASWRSGTVPSLKMFVFSNDRMIIYDLIKAHI